MQSSIVLSFEACLAVSKVMNCIAKACKGGGMLWYGYIIVVVFLILKDVKVKLVQPFLWYHEMTDGAWPTSSGNSRNAVNWVKEWWENWQLILVQWMVLKVRH